MKTAHGDSLTPQDGSNLAASAKRILTAGKEDCRRVNPLRVYGCPDSSVILIVLDSCCVIGPPARTSFR